MQYFVAMAILALAAVFDTTWAATVPKKRDADLATHVTGSGPTPMLVPFYDENLDPAETTFGIQKRGYFTCYNTAACSLLICTLAIASHTDQVTAHPRSALGLRACPGRHSSCPGQHQCPGRSVHGLVSHSRES